MADSAYGKLRIATDWEYINALTGATPALVWRAVRRAVRERRAKA